MRRIPHLLAAAMTIMMLAVAAGCTGSGRKAGSDKLTATEKVAYLTGAGVQGCESYIYVAMDKGFFREVGLEVEVRPGNGTVQNLQVLQSGQADFAVVDITAALIEYGRSGAKFTDFTVVSAIQQRNLACVMALDGSGIAGPRDLAGKRIAYIPGGVVKTLFDPYARLAGVDGSKISWVSMPVPQMGPNLAAGSIDAATQFVVGRPAVEGALSPQRMARNIAAIRGAGVVPAEFKPEDVVTFDFAPKG